MNPRSGKEQTMKKIFTIVTAILVLAGLAGGLTAAFAFDRPSGDTAAPFASGMCAEDEPDCNDTVVIDDDDDVAKPPGDQPPVRNDLDMEPDECDYLQNIDACRGNPVVEDPPLPRYEDWLKDHGSDGEGSVTIEDPPFPQYEDWLRDHAIEGVPDTSGPCLESEPDFVDTVSTVDGDSVGIPVDGSAVAKPLPDDAEILCDLPTVDPVEPDVLERPGYPDGVMIPDPNEATNGNAPCATTSVSLETAPIESIEIQVMKSYPPKYAVRVISGLPNSCASFGGYHVRRSGDTIDIRILSMVTGTAESVACAEIYGFVETSIFLGSDFESGNTYEVLVNGVSETFVAQ
jgi:hypothetical protein